MKAFIRPSTDADRIELAQTMCSADRTELQHLGVTPSQALAYCDLNDTYTVDLDGSVVAMFGVLPLCDSYGRIWMLSTDDTRRCTSLLRVARHFVKEQAQKYQFLTNVAWSKNTAHLNWIDWLGFHFTGIETYNGEQFIRFSLHKQQI